MIPLDNSPWATAGRTDSKGTTTFWSHGKFPGVPAGKYKVDLIKHETEPTSGGSNTYTLIDPNLAPIEIEVVVGKNNFEPFDLGKKVRVLLKP